MTNSPFKIHAPARVCLFGEHSDYIGLDVIPAAIDLGIDIFACPREDDLIVVDYLDLGTHDEFTIGTLLEYRHNRDYLRSAFNVAFDNDLIPDHGWHIEVKGDVPIAGGLSSSSALTVASTLLVNHICGSKPQQEDLVRMAFEAEVERFGESGGMMDHYASIYGGIIHVSMESDRKVTRLPAEIDGLVIGDSQQKKDTVEDLRKMRKAIEAGYAHIRSKIPDFNRRTTLVERVYDIHCALPDSEVMMAEGSLRNRNLTARALDLLSERHPDEKAIGNLLNKQHSILRYLFARSTPKIDMMIDSALKAGALGCKINGSGGGGTMLAYAPNKEEEVSEAIRSAGGIPYKVKIGQGASLAIIEKIS